MDIVNHDYPRGNKFYPVGSTRIQEKCAELFTTTTYKAAKHLATLNNYNNEYLNSSTASRWTSNLEIIGDEHLKFPRFKIRYSSAFRAVSEGIGEVAQHRKANYQSILRIRDLGNMPWAPDMEVQWDNERKGFIVYNVAYEGELELVPRSGISKAITEVLKDLVAETGMFELLGESVYMEYQYKNTVELDKKFKSSFEDLLNGKHTTEQASYIAVGSGAYRLEYDSDRANALYANNTTRRKLDYYKLTRNKGVKPKISTVTRTSLMYKYGGYKLPDNYQDWFDG